MLESHALRGCDSVPPSNPENRPRSLIATHYRLWKPRTPYTTAGVEFVVKLFPS